MIRRMATMGQTSPEIIKEVERGLEHRMSSVMSQQFENAGGVSSVAEILNVIDRTTERSLLENLAQEDPDLVEEIRRLMFVFEDIAKLGNREIQTLLKNVESSQWAMALKGASAELKDKVLSNMSKRASDLLREEMEYLGPVRLSNVEQMQQQIVDVVRRLEDAGEITTHSRGTGRAVYPVARRAVGTVPIFVRRKWDCPLWPPDFRLPLPDHARINVQVEVFDQSGLEPLDGDGAHHGVVGAEPQRGDVQSHAAALGLLFQPLAQPGVGRHAAAHAQDLQARSAAGRPRPCRPGNRPQPPESWPPGRPPVAAQAELA